MVCLGNICRSPLAEGVLQSKLNPANFKVDSCGTGSYHIGKAPDPRSVKVARSNGIDISLQKAAQFHTDFFDEYDFIFTMDTENYHNIVDLATSDKQRSKASLLLKTLDDPTLTEVPDPYYGEEQGFERVFDLIDKACTKIAHDLQPKI